MIKKQIQIIKTKYWTLEGKGDKVIKIRKSKQICCKGWKIDF